MEWLPEPRPLTKSIAYRPRGNSERMLLCAGNRKNPSGDTAGTRLRRRSKAQARWVANGGAVAQRQFIDTIFGLAK